MLLSKYLLSFAVIQIALNFGLNDVFDPALNDPKSDLKAEYDKAVEDDVRNF